MTDTLMSSKYLNRELSWLEFNQRVLAEALDVGVPLLERLKFLAITASNLDEFFMVRVGSLQMLLAQGSTSLDPSGLTPEQQLQAIGTRTHHMTVEQYACFLQDLEPKLTEAGIRRRRAADLTPRQAKLVEQLFDDELSSILTPIAVTSSEDFPLLATQSLTVCVRLDPAKDDEKQRPRFAIVPFGKLTSRFVSLPAESDYEFMLVEDVVALARSEVFPRRVGAGVRAVPDHSQRRLEHPRGSRPRLAGRDGRGVGSSGAPERACGWKSLIR